jgi:anaerobic ribonucleoside-triphosphate reductase activating protein
VKEIYVTLQNSMNNDGLWYPSISIYYSGCDNPNKCIECQNPELQLQGIGYKTTNSQLIQDVENKLIEWLDTYETMSICYVGGEPLAEWNRESTLEVSKYFKEKYKNKICNILYSWRYIEDFLELEQYILYIDYGVLGNFQIQNRDINCIPSSSNQYIYSFIENKKINTIKKG